MSKRPFILFGIFAALCILVLPFFALGKEGDAESGAVQVASADQEAKDMFATNCGTCHTLAAAGTDGVVGPNLDELLVPSGTNSARALRGQRDPGAHRGRVRPRRADAEGHPRGGRGDSRWPQFVAAYAGQIGKGPVVDIADQKPPTYTCSSG